MLFMNSSFLGYFVSKMHKKDVGSYLLDNMGSLSDVFVIQVLILI